MSARPTLLNGCAMAATAAEARFRINGPNPPARATRIVALDRGAATLISRVAKQRWQGAHFFTYEPGSPGVDGDGGPPEIVLRAPDGSRERLSEVVPRRNATEVLAASRAREHREAANRTRYQAGELSLDVHRLRERLEQKGLEYVDQAADD